MKQRLLAMILALVLSLGPDVPAFAEDEPSVTYSETPQSAVAEDAPDTSGDILNIPADIPAPSGDMPDTSEDTPVIPEDAPLAYLPVELILQNPRLPNGCEVTSLAMALASAGYPIDNLELYQTYMPCGAIRTSGGRRYGPDPEKFYAGDATKNPGGWYCFEKPVIQTANAWLEHCESGLSAWEISGLSQDELDEYAQAGIPVVVWVTLSYGAPRRSSYTWRLPDGTVYKPYSNLHCVLLTGLENGKYKIADPISGWRTVGRDKFWSCFDAMGRRAVVIGRDAP